MSGKLFLSWAVGSAFALLSGLLAGPAALYWFGSKALGEYGHPGGLLTLRGSIYGDAAGFGAAGLVFLLGPLAMFQIAWATLFALKKYLR